MPAAEMENYYTVKAFMAARKFGGNLSVRLLKFQSCCLPGRMLHPLLFQLDQEKRAPAETSTLRDWGGKGNYKARVRLPGLCPSSPGLSLRQEPRF